MQRYSNVNVKNLSGNPVPVLRATWSDNTYAVHRGIARTRCGRTRAGSLAVFTV